MRLPPLGAVPAIVLALTIAGCDHDPATTTGPDQPAFTNSHDGFGSPAVLPSHSHPFGKSYGEWSAAWWRWAYSIPVASNPLLDETGAQCGVAQSGPVWFLAGVFNVSGTAVRDDCVVPAGKALFLPLLNAECSNVEGNGTTPAELRACANGLIDLVTDLAADVDGAAIGHLTNFRAQSPPFGFRLPSDNLLQLFGFVAPAGSCLPSGGSCTPYRSVGDGYFVMLAPLAPGHHTIHFHGAIPDFGFALDITYHLTVRSDHHQDR